MFRAVSLFLSVWLSLVVSSGAIVLHPDGEPEPDWPDRPGDGAVGQWNNNASCVVIGRNYVLTTKHQGGGVDSIVKVEGVSYQVDEIWYEPGGEDIRVARLRRANLTDFVRIYTSTYEVGKEIAVGGYGMCRGEELESGDSVYGYSWSYPLALRWCSNRVDPSSFNNMLEMDFDELDDFFATNYEGAIAGNDSGGGWFCNFGGYWYVLGLSCWVVDHSGESWFGDGNWAVQVSCYADWIINGVLATEPDCEYLDGDLNDDCVVDLGDLIEFVSGWLGSGCGPENNFCERMDFEPHDGKVDLRDYVVLSKLIDQEF